MADPHTGWFRADASQGGRTLDEQLLGLGPAIAAARDGRVLDLGCAEGLIGAEFLRAGAHAVDGVEANPAFAEAARALATRTPGLRVIEGDLNQGLPAAAEPPYHVVLALAVLHKLREPAAAMDWLAAATGHLLVVRLQRRSQGMVWSKYFRDSECDLCVELPARGLFLGATLEGPRGELVQYWHRPA